MFDSLLMTRRAVCSLLIESVAVKRKNTANISPTVIELIGLIELEQ